MNSGLTPDPELDSNAEIVLSTLVSIFSLKSSILFSTSLLNYFRLFSTLLTFLVVSKLILFIFSVSESIALLATPL